MIVVLQTTEQQPLVTLAAVWELEELTRDEVTAFNTAVKHLQDTTATVMSRRQRKLVSALSPNNTSRFGRKLLNGDK